MSSRDLKLVLLPGMDGTGLLFNRFLEYYGGENQVIRLPLSGEQGYEELAEYVIHKLPSEGYILLAESFSGGLVPEIVSKDSGVLKGVIFVAGFLSPPNRLLLAVARFLPLKFFAFFPGAQFFYTSFFFGSDASKEAINEFLSALSGVPRKAISARLSSMSNMVFPDTFRSDIPCIYVRPRQDKLVGKAKAEEICKSFRRCKIVDIDGPHFILQAKPQELAQIIATVIESLQAR